MGYIFEAEIDIIRNTVRARTIGEEETIRLRDILLADIHPAIKAYFKADVEHLLEEERRQEVRSNRFPYSLPEVARLLRQIDLLLVYHYQFGQHDFDIMLDHAVHFQFNFLCRPQWTLLSFIFENQRRKGASEIERKLRYCLDYPYYTEIIERYMEERGVAEMTYEEFSTLLEKIDREIVSEHSSVELALMARPMLKFIEAGQPRLTDSSADSRIPINAAIVFFEDKKLNDIKERLEKERDLNEMGDITLHLLADFIEKVRTGNEEATVEFPRNRAQPAPADTETRTQERSGVGSAPSTESFFKKQPSKLYSDFYDEEPMALPVEPPPGPEKVGNVPAPRNGGELADIHTLFTPSEQKAFVRMIFRRDDVEFREAVDRLNALADWTEAAEYLKELFVANDVDPFSEEAILFTDKIQSRFTQSGGNEQ